MLRIRKTGWKVVYFVVGVVLVNVLNSFVVTRLLPGPLDSIVATLLTIILVLGAARTFRGRGEPLNPPRAWWRATARPTASYVVGALWAADILLAMILVATQQAGYSVLGLISNVLLAAFFFHSAVRLQRSPQPTVPDPIPAPRFKPIKR